MFCTNIIVSYCIVILTLLLILLTLPNIVQPVSQWQSVIITHNKTHRWSLNVKIVAKEHNDVWSNRRAFPSRNSQYEAAPTPQLLALRRKGPRHGHSEFYARARDIIFECKGLSTNKQGCWVILLVHITTHFTWFRYVKCSLRYLKTVLK